MSSRPRSSNCVSAATARSLRSPATSTTAVRVWVKQVERDTATRDDGGLTSTERDELAALRRENRRLREDVDILKRATAFFAKETR